MARIIVSYEKSNKDIPVLVVAKENLCFSFNPTLDIIKTFTGDEATELYKELTGKEVKNNGN